MMDISCDACGKKYRVDETKMKREMARVKCKACNNLMVVTKPRPEVINEPSPAPEIYEPSMPPDIPEPPATPPQTVPPSAVERVAAPVEVKTAAPEEDTSAFLSGQKIRFGLFGKIIIVMLIVSLLPFAIFWGITLRETNQRIRTETEKLLAQTAKGLGEQVDWWIDNNVSVLRTVANLSEITSMSREEQEPILKAIQKEHPWMYLVFTLGADGINIAPQRRQKFKGLFRPPVLQRCHRWEKAELANTDWQNLKKTGSGACDSDKKRGPAGGGYRSSHDH